MYMGLFYQKYFDSVKVLKCISNKYIIKKINFENIGGKFMTSSKKYFYDYEDYEDDEKLFLFANKDMGVLISEEGLKRGNIK